MMFIDIDDDRHDSNCHSELAGGGSVNVFYELDGYFFNGSS